MLKHLKLILGSIAVACVAAIPYTPAAAHVWLAGAAAVAAALVRFWSPPPSDGGGANGGTGGGNGARERIVLPLRSEPPPSHDRVAFARLLAVPAMLALMAALASCSTVRDVVWQPIATCSDTPEQVFADVLAALRADPGASLSDKGLAALETIAKKYSSAEFVQCAVGEILDTFAGAADAEELRLRAKARDFFERTGTRVE